MAETLVEALAVLAMAALLWREPPTVALSAVAGLLLATAVLTRTVAIVMILPVLALALGRRWGLRRCIALCSFALLPLVAYASWFHHVHGRFALESLEVGYSTDGSRPTCRATGRHYRRRSSRCACHPCHSPSRPRRTRPRAAARSTSPGTRTRRSGSFVPPLAGKRTTSRDVTPSGRSSGIRRPTPEASGRRFCGSSPRREPPGRGSGPFRAGSSYHGPTRRAGTSLCCLPSRTGSPCRTSCDCLPCEHDHRWACSTITSDGPTCPDRRSPPPSRSSCGLGCGLDGAKAAHVGRWEHWPWRAGYCSFCLSPRPASTSVTCCRH